jgi:hypothetical protein
MNYHSFWRLHQILKPHMMVAFKMWTQYKKKGGRKKIGGASGNFSNPPVPNGSIVLSVHLACAIWYFGGGSPSDIALLYWEALSSAWISVAAINMCPQFNISYPESLEEQQKIAAAFQCASTPGIPNCAGAIDGILIWIIKPSTKDALESGIGQKNLLCGRKN